MFKTLVGTALVGLALADGYTEEVQHHDVSIGEV
jgi:hypothetical protein